MLPGIPASQFVNVVPGVIGAGGNALDLSGVFLTASTRMISGELMAFPNYAAVAAYFGAGSSEAADALIYFNGADNATAVPGQIFFYQYTNIRLPSYLRGGNLGTLNLTALQALPAGTITITIDGTPFTSSSINLSSAGSFSAAATAIQTALNAFDASCTTGSIAGTVLTVAGTVTGTFAVGQVITGTGITQLVFITSLGSGTGGTGTYNLNIAPGTVSSTLITAGLATVSYDSISNAFVITSGTRGSTSSIGFAANTLATSLNLTQATGAVISPGSAISAPAQTMQAIVAQSTNWALFTTVFEPQTADALAFAAWTSGQNNRFAYVPWDTDTTPTMAGDTSSLGYQLLQTNPSGVILVWQPSDLGAHAFVLGWAASINFLEENGRTNLAYSAQSGLTPGVTNATVASYLQLSGYNYYCAAQTANQNFNFFYPGSCMGPFQWADSYVNQIKLNSDLQLALLEMLVSFKNIPFNQAGYGYVDAACADPIEAALNFGTIRAGVPLSNAQAAQVDASVSPLVISPTISNLGWYLSIPAATAQARAARGPLIPTLYYTDGQSVQTITLASIEVE